MLRFPAIECVNPMLRTLTAVVFIVLGSQETSRADTLAIPGLYNTGLNSNGALLTGGQVDPHYTLISSSDPSHTGPSAFAVTGYPTSPAGPWLADGPNSEWISPRSDGGNEPSGFYDYETTFDLTGLDPATAQISGVWTVDDSIGNLLINGVSTGQTLGGTYLDKKFYSFTISSGFQPGVNTLEFDTYNAELPTGFRAELHGTATAVPEPTGLTCFGGFFILWSLRRRVRKIVI